MCKQFIVLVVALCLSANLVHGFGSLFSYDFDNEVGPSEARNLRASVRYHWTLANRAQRQMLEAMRVDDVDGYEQWLETMREEDDKWQLEAAEYDQIRDIMESKIRTGELEILNFEQRHQKGNIASIIDHLTFRAKSK